jgi:hypothetical protein
MNSDNTYDLISTLPVLENDNGEVFPQHLQKILENNEKIWYRKYIIIFLLFFTISIVDYKQKDIISLSPYNEIISFFIYSFLKTLFFVILYYYLNDMNN